MSPLQIQIMLHYYARPVDYSDCPKSFVIELCEVGMLTQFPSGPEMAAVPEFGISDKGKAYVDYLCAVPLPVEERTYSFGVKP